MPLEYMLEVMNDPTADQARRDRMAMAAAPFLHARPTDTGATGKKEKAQAGAVTAQQGTDWETLLPVARVQ